MSEKRPEAPTIKVVMTGDEQPVDRADVPSDMLLAGRYRIRRRLGKGGMGEVMSAHDEQVGRDVAIKRMRAANPSQRAVARFVREATVQGRLEHPAIVPVHEVGLDSDGLPFFVMKKLSGTSLAVLLQDPANFPRQRALRAFADVCLAVELAHTKGVIHRDLKPDNIMLGDFGEVYILDWGVAKVTGETEDGEFADVGSGSGDHATGAGIAIGTPGYMSPEQVRGDRDIDGRADIYTLGCVLFEILAGEPLHPRGGGGRARYRTGARRVVRQSDAAAARRSRPDRARARRARTTLPRRRSRPRAASPARDRAPRARAHRFCRRR
jgi:serine/threonine protein kinase